MTTPRDPWHSADLPPSDFPDPEALGDARGDELSDEVADETLERFSSDAFTVPIDRRGLTRPLSWSRPAPRAPILSRRLLDRSTLPTLFLGIGIGVVVTSIVAALIVAGRTGSASTSRAVATVPTAAHTLPTVTPTRTPTPTPVPSVAATFNGTDATAQGTWQGVYGGQGAVVIGDTQQLPAGIAVAPGGAAEATWAPTTADPRAVQKISTPGDRIAACWYAPTTFTIDVNITDGQAHHVALYLLDFDSNTRSEAISVIDPATNAPLDTRIASGFTNGQYLIWTIRGHVVLTITNNAGSPNAVASALYFDKA